MGVKEFFKNAFADMKEIAKQQHEVDKANFEAAKAESKATFEENRAFSNAVCVRLSKLAPSIITIL